MTEPTADRTWRRFTLIVAVLTGMALLVGMALSYSSAYSGAYDAGFDRPWIYGHGWQLRPAHLFPLTLDLPVFAAYLGIIALAGRPSVSWARGILVACAGATVSLQVIDATDLIKDHASIRAVIHGWPPALAILTTHLLVKIVQALGFLVPPVAEPARTPWAVRAVRWLVATMTGVGDIWGTRKRPSNGHPQGHRTDTMGATETDTGGTPEGQTDGQIEDTETDTQTDSGRTSGGHPDGQAGDTRTDKPRTRRGRPGTILPFAPADVRVLRQAEQGQITYAEAGLKLGVSAKTVGRRVNDLRRVDREKTG